MLHFLFRRLFDRIVPFCYATKVARYDGGGNIVFSENQYPVFRGLAEQAQFDGVPCKAGQVPHFQFQDEGFAVAFNRMFAEE